MRKLTLFFASLISLAACGEPKDPGHEGHDHDAHAHAARHGGELIPLGEHEGFIEVKLDHSSGVLSMWVYIGEAMRDASVDGVPLLNLKTSAGPKQLKGTGSGGIWTFRDEALKHEPESARFRLTVGGKTYSPEWAHDHDHGEGEEHDEHDEHEGHDHD